ncbi:DUF6338 family protein [Isoptericola nanjingensis]|uniref:DUF6338 family protein n=1 Tax=Isoptericola nanjingensis TaxID=903413 RepID=UPI003D1F0D6B
MIPSGSAALVSFLLLVAPGMVWQFQQARHEPAVKETVLVEASRVVIASLVATGAAGLALSWMWVPLYERVRTADPDALSLPGATVPYFAAAAATSLLACGLALLAAAFKWPGRAPISAGRAWSQAFVGRRPPNTEQPWLIVELLDGTVWKGTLQHFDTDPDDDHRALLLGEDLMRRDPGAKEFKPVGDAGRNVILPESQIKSTQVQYIALRPSEVAAPAGAEPSDGETEVGR